VAWTTSNLDAGSQREPRRYLRRGSFLIRAAPDLQDNRIQMGASRESNKGDQERLRQFAVEAVALGSAIVRARFLEHTAKGEVKGAGDYVTAVDRESEDAIRSFLQRATPDIPVLAEESGGERGDRFWAVDPLDGTTSFLLGFPVVAVSVALIEQGRPLAGAVQGPMLELSFSAFRGGGAWSGSRRIRVSDRPPERAVIAMALPFRAKSVLPRYMAALEDVFARTEDIRRAGAASLDLAWVACGVFDGYFELNLSVWDVAAGALLVEEAGGVVTDWEGGSGYLSGNVIAGSPQTHGVLLEAARSTAERAR
jgi:myo-inositol-1(or 4)-monophosphatase